MQLGVVEIANQRVGNFSLTPISVGQIAAAHGLMAVGVGLPILLLSALLTWLLGRNAGGSTQPGWRGLTLRFLPFSPAFGTLLVLVWKLAEARFLRGIVASGLDLESLISLALGSMAVLLVAAGPCLLWAFRSQRRSLNGAVVAALLAVNFAVCWWGATAPAVVAPHSGTQTAAASTGSPNLILILVDTLRADHLGTYGYGRDTSPNIDRLAEQGLVFERAYSTSNWTRPAVASIFTSTMPSRHQVFNFFKALSPSLPLLAEVLSDHGYQTGFFTVGINVEPSDGYSRGVDRFFHGRTRSPVERSLLFQRFLFSLAPPVRMWFRQRNLNTAGNHPEIITKHALEWVNGADRDRGIFMFVHYPGPHSPYLPPPPYDKLYSNRAPEKRLAHAPSRDALTLRAWAGRDALSPEDRQQLINQYDGKVVQHDVLVQQLLDGLRAAGRLENAVVLLTADHGEGFGEHGIWDHELGMFDELVRVPLIAWGPPLVRRGRTQVPVSLIDIAPTLVELAGARSPSSFDGGSVARLLKSPDESERIVFIENPVRNEIGLRNGSWAYFEGISIDGMRRWLYRSDDRLQENDLSEEYPELVEEYSALLRQRRQLDIARRHESVVQEMDAMRIEELKALGYLQDD